MLDQYSSDDFETFLARLRTQEDDAIRSFVSKYEPSIRRSLRFRIERASLQTAADSEDISQLVLGGFLMRLTAGDYSLSSEEDLRRLLMAIADKKFLILNRRETAAKRDHRKTQSLEKTSELADTGSEKPYKHVDRLDLIDEVTKRLSSEEQKLFAWRLEGMSWNSIANRLPGDIHVLKKRLSRALNRVARDLKLHDKVGQG